MFVTKLHPQALLPVRCSAEAAGYDLHACLKEPISIAPDETKIINTGLAMAVPKGHFGAIYARSGLACKFGIRPANCVGIIDSDYRGEIIVALHNDSQLPFVVEPNMRIAQIIFQSYSLVSMDEVDTLPESKRGTGGFGSTGV